MNPTAFPSIFNGVNSRDLRPAVQTFGDGLVAWLPSETLPRVDDSIVFERWEDVSGLDRDAVGVHTFTGPFISPVGPDGAPRVQIDLTGYMVFPGDIQMGHEVSIYLAGFLPVPTPFPNSYQMVLEPDGASGNTYEFSNLFQLAINGFLSVVFQSVSDQSLKPFHLSFRRKGISVDLNWRDVASVSADWTSLNDVCEGIGRFEMFGTAVDFAVNLAEVIVFARRLSDSEDAAILSYLASKYPSG